MAAPATIVIAKLLRPEVDTPETSGAVKVKIEHEHANVIEAAAGDSGCEIERTLTAGNLASFTGFGALGDNQFIDILGRSGHGNFSLEADELILTVASMPGGGIPVSGLFDITVSVSYDVIHRAEF